MSCSSDRFQEFGGGIPQRRERLFGSIVGTLYLTLVTSRIEIEIFCFKTKVQESSFHLILQGFTKVFSLSRFDRWELLRGLKYWYLYVYLAIF